MISPFDDDNLALDPDFADRFADQRKPACQLYLVSPLDVTGGFSDRLAATLDVGPVAAFQYRVKGIDQHEAARLGEPLRRICADHDVAFIVNDDMALAKRLGADGVHLGQGDGCPTDARLLLGADAQIGISCHGSRHLAMAAGEGGADYIAFGAFFPTKTKMVEHYADLALIGWWTTVSEIPCVAIGGITAENCAPLVAAGADFIAVSGSVWASADGPAAAVMRLGTVMRSPASARRYSRAVEY